MDPFRYRISVEWSAEDEAFVARVPALACAAHGTTVQAATAEVYEAARGMLEGSEAAPPSDIVGDTYSGNIRLRLPKSLHRQLAERADADGVSLNVLMVSVLAASVAVRPVLNGAASLRVVPPPRLEAEAICASDWSALNVG